MESILAALRDQQAELSGLLVDLDDAGWRQPSRCAGWSVADVVLHLAQTNEMAIGSASGRFAEATAALTEGLEPAADVDEGADRMVARDRDQPTAAILHRWQASADELLGRLQGCAPRARVTWVTGELSVQTLATTRLAETWIHTGDVADALGHEPHVSERLWHIARLAWRTLPYAFARAGRELHGPVAFELEAEGIESWSFEPDEQAVTTVRGDALELCLVAARRATPAETSLEADGPDADAVLELVRTYA